MGTRAQSVAVDPYSGPYKATRIWNDVVLAFRENVPNGRHRRFMKVFDNCFSGSSATDWLLQFLQSNRNFDPDVKREKAVSLLNKLYSAGIFEEVKISRSMQHKVTVQDNRLYRLLPASPSKFKTTRLPLAPRNNFGPDNLVYHTPKKSSDEMKYKNYSENSKPRADAKKSSTTAESKPDENSSTKTREAYPKCHLIPKVLTGAEITDVWKRTFILRMKKALSISRFADILSEDVVHGASIMHNCLFLNKNGTVTNIPPADQLPHWVLSAMKCLARWPEHHEEGLPSYPGFEKDIFCVVKSYFLGLKEPLIPFHLYDAVTNVFVTASSRSSGQDDHLASKERDSIIKNLWTTASLDNVILDLSKKHGLIGSTEHFYDEEHLHANDFTKESFQSQDNVHFVYNNGEGGVCECEGKASVQHRNNVCNDLHSLRRAPKQQHLPRSVQSTSGLPQMRLSRSVHSSTSGLPQMHLSRSVHSTSGLPQRYSKHLPMRKFESTPNLKISKYETAFGPDNRTVTRVFFQNGVCTDYEHNKELHSSFSPIETHFSASSEDLGACENPVNFDKAQSLESVNMIEATNGIGLFRNVNSLPRSKSFASRSEFVGDNFLMNHRKDASHAHCDGLQSRRRANVLNRSAEADKRASLWASQESLSACNTLEPVTESPDRERKLSHNSFSDRHGNEKLKPSVVPHHSSTCHLSPGPIIHNGSRTSVNGDDFVAGHAHLSPTTGHNPITPHNGRGELSPTDSTGYGPGYRPVLDASKERTRSISCTNLSPQCHNSSRTRPLSSVFRNRNHVTSTPMSPASFSKPNHLGGSQSGISLSSLTPFYRSDRRNLPSSHKNEFMAYPQTRLSEERARNCLQLMTLLVTPAKRRKLHMLFKMMVKMAANPNLCLDSSQTTRSLVLGTFYPAIMRTEKESDFDEMLVLQLLSFMFDYYDDIFTPPSDLKAQVSEKLKQMQRPRISYSPRPISAPVQFCRQISTAAYEKERNIVSRQAMADLLENIIRDIKMSSKEKKKRLKQFQMTYPTLYKNRFPTPESEAELFPETSRPKLRQPLMGKPMGRLRGLRL